MKKYPEEWFVRLVAGIATTPKTTDQIASEMGLEPGQIKPMIRISCKNGWAFTDDKTTYIATGVRPTFSQAPTVLPPLVTRPNAWAELGKKKKPTKPTTTPKRPTLAPPASLAPHCFTLGGVSTLFHGMLEAAGAAGVTQEALLKAAYAAFPKETRKQIRDILIKRQKAGKVVYRAENATYYDPKHAPPGESTLTFCALALRVLEKAATPLAPPEILREATALGLRYKTDGKTPENTLRTLLLRHAQKPNGAFVLKAGSPARYWLRSRLEAAGTHPTGT